ncbi:MAG: DUF3392 domain-containing protein [Gammaproteobacteria bacterium]|nr:DUF3392 domain-containing protein [Gammaproteobacteria bacterium]
MQSFLINIATFIKPYVMQVSIILVTCSLVVVDTYIHGRIKRAIRGLNFIFRIAIYVLLFTFVYGFMITFLSPPLAKFLFTLSPGMLISFLFFSFILLGIFIERK